MLVRVRVPTDPEQQRELDRLSCRYFVDRVYSREQLLERCRRVYEMDPKDTMNPAQEVMDLMLSARPRPVERVCGLLEGVVWFVC